MAGNVVVDGSEPVRSIGAPSPLWLAMAVLAAVVAVIVTVLSGPDLVPAPVGPDETYPELESGVDGWRRLVLPGSGTLAAVAHDDELVVAGGAGPQFWWSPDSGATWHLSPTRVADAGEVTGMAVGTPGAVAVGSVVEPTGDGASRGVLWTSADGREWTETAADIGGPDSGFDGVVEFQGRFVAWGWTGDSDDFAPGVGPLLATSDGDEWKPVDLSGEGTRLRAVRRAGGRWLVMGSREGQPALWASTDLATWEQVPTDRMPFGWTMVDAYDDGALTVNLLDPGSDATHRYRRLEDGTWMSLGDPIVSGPVVMDRELDGLTGVGAGRLWVTDPGWEAMDLEGALSAADGDVAVGMHDGQPVVWVRSQEAAPTVAPEQIGDILWEEWLDLGPGPLGGPFPLGEGALVGSGEGWWFVDRHEALPVDGLDGAVVEGVSRIGDQWVATPAMRWTSEGTRWEGRGIPWSDAEGGRVDAVTVIGGVALAVGTDGGGLRLAASSDDMGSTWSVIEPPMPSTPIRTIAAAPDGFVAVAARPRNRSQVVSSADGLEWADLPFEALVGGPTLALLGDGVITLPETGLEFAAPTTSQIDAVARSVTGRVAVVSGRRLWLGPDQWELVPADPLAGLAGGGPVPFFVGGDLVVASVDRGVVMLHRPVD